MRGWRQVVIVLLVSGCAATSRPAPTTGNHAEVASPGALTGTRQTNESPSLALEAYSQLSSQDGQILDTAAAAAQDLCILKSGVPRRAIQAYVEWTHERRASIARAGAAAGLPAISTFTAGVLGVSDLAVARTYGYANPWDTVIHDQARVQLPVATKVTPAFDAAQIKCRDSGPQTSLPGGIDEAEPAELELKAQRLALASPAVARGVAAWRTCMTGMGFTFATPYEVPSDPKGSPIGTFVTYDDFTAPSHRELAVAVADVECKQSTGLPTTYNDANAMYQRQLVKQYATDLDAYRRGLAAEVTKAEQLLTSTPYRGVLGLAEAQAAVADTPIGVMPPT